MNSPLIETAVDEARSLSSHSTNRRTPSSIETVGFQPSRCFAASRLKTGRVEGDGFWSSHRGTRASGLFGKGSTETSRKTVEASADTMKSVQL